jgi:predicted dehydrogenase
MMDAAIVGLGRWGKSIVEAAQGKSKRLHFIRGVSKEPELVRDFAQRHGFDLSTEFADIIADPCVRAVVLATPHSLHVEQIVAAAAAGKAIWCEKPLALTRADAARAIAAVTKAGVAFGLGNNKRCFASMRELKQIVAAGVLGEVLHIEGHFSNEHSTRVAGGWRDDPREAPGGGMTGAGLHLIDAFVNLAGPIAEVHAKVFSQKLPPDPRDAAAVLVRFESGATGLLATVRAAPMFWRVHCSAAKVRPKPAAKRHSLLQSSVGSWKRGHSRRSTRLPCCWRLLPRAPRRARPFRSLPPRCSMWWKHSRQSFVP